MRNLLPCLIILSILCSSCTAPSHPPLHPTVSYLDPALADFQSARPEEWLSLIVTSSDWQQAAHAVQTVGGTVSSDLWLIDAVAARLPADRVSDLAAQPGILSIVLDKPVRTASDGDATSDPDRYLVTSPAAVDVGADILHDPSQRGYAITGAGVTIAIVDSGVHLNPQVSSSLNNAIASTFLHQADFVGNGACQGQQGASQQSGYCLTNATDSRDPYGHGSHIHGILANRLHDDDLPTTLGVAPDAGILSVRVLGNDGIGTYEDVVEGIQYVVANKISLNIGVLNLSLAATAGTPYFIDPINRAAEAAWQAGIVVVAAAGNTGPLAQSITVPGNDPYVITVGAFSTNGTPNRWDDDFVPSWSAAGPTVDGFLKPDILAPGANIVSYMYNDSSNQGNAARLVQTHPDYASNKKLFRLNGTSMATAVASGVVALMLQTNPTLTPGQVKYRLMYSARSAVTNQNQLIESLFQQGSGRIWAPDAALAPNIALDDANESLNLTADLAHPWNTNEDALPSNLNDSDGDGVPNSTTTINVGLLGYWKMEENGGSAILDYSGHGHHGAKQQNMTWDDGHIGPAIRTDGRGEHARVPASSRLNGLSTGLTLSAWVFRKENQTGVRAVMSRQAGLSAEQQFALGFNNNAYLFSLKTNSGVSSTVTAALAPTREWQHLAATYDGALMRLYVNGVLVSSAAQSGPISVADRPLIFGAQQTSNNSTSLPNGFDGRMDEMRLYNRALSSAEIGAIYDWGNPAASVTIALTQNSACGSTGTIVRELWLDVAGDTVAAIPLYRTPDDLRTLSSFEAPSGSNSNFGARVRGYLCPPTSGVYNFWIASDNQSELWLSTDSNPANQHLIASVPNKTAVREWTKYPQQASAPISLTAGVWYYIEALHKNGDSTNNLAVAWRPPGGTQVVIPKQFLAPYVGDQDDDNDGIPNSVEQQRAANDGDSDGLGLPDALDLDSDNDGLFDLHESGLTPALVTQLDANNDGRLDASGVVGSTGVGLNGLLNRLETITDSNVISYSLADTGNDGSLNSQSHFAHFSGPVLRMVSDDGQYYLYYRAIPNSSNLLALGAARVSDRTWVDLNQLQSASPTFNQGQISVNNGLVWGGDRAWGGSRLWGSDRLWGGSMVGGVDRIWGGQRAWGGNRLWGGTIGSASHLESSSAGIASITAPPVGMTIADYLAVVNDPVARAGLGTPSIHDYPLLDAPSTEEMSHQVFLPVIATDVPLAELQKPTAPVTEAPTITLPVSGEITGTLPLTETAVLTDTGIISEPGAIPVSGVITETGVITDIVSVPG